jgi:hypothetical protein
MDIKKLGLGLGAFAAGAAAWTWGASRYGDKLARGLNLDPALDNGTGAVPGDSTTSPVAPRPATMAAAPVGMAETEKGHTNAPGNEGHVPVDLMAAGDPGAGGRADPAFRPDPTAVPTDAEREALRPATGPAPTLVADRGSGFSEAAGAA